MQETLLAKRYAKALFELALEQDLLEEVRKDMGLLLEVISTSKDFQVMLRSPVIRPDRKAAIMQAIFGNEVISMTLGFFRLLTRNRRERHLDTVAREFIEIYKKHHHIISLEIKTAREISPDLRDRIITRFEKFTGGKIELSEKVDEKLIGGFVVNWEDNQYDATLLRKMNLLKKEFEKNLYIREF